MQDLTLAIATREFSEQLMEIASQQYRNVAIPDLKTWPYANQQIDVDKWYPSLKVKLMFRQMVRGVLICITRR
jgi:hypothetical protein